MDDWEWEYYYSVDELADYNDSIHSAFTASGELLQFTAQAVLEDREKSFLVLIDHQEYWLPKKCCFLSTNKKIVSVPRWLVRRKGIIADKLEDLNPKL